MNTCSCNAGFSGDTCSTLGELLDSESPSLTEQVTFVIIIIIMRMMMKIIRMMMMMMITRRRRIIALKSAIP